MLNHRDTNSHSNNHLDNKKSPLTTKPTTTTTKPDRIQNVFLHTQESQGGVSATTTPGALFPGPDAATTPYDRLYTVGEPHRPIYGT